MRQACLLLFAALPHPTRVWSTCEQEKETSDILNDQLNKIFANVLPACFLCTERCLIWPVSYTCAVCEISFCLVVDRERLICPGVLCLRWVLGCTVYRRSELDSLPVEGDLGPVFRLVH